MAITGKTLVGGSQLTASAVTYYTAPTSTRTQIQAMTLTNTTAGAISALVLQLGGPRPQSFGDATEITKEKPGLVSRASSSIRIDSRRRRKPGR